MPDHRVIGRWPRVRIDPQGSAVISCWCAVQWRHVLVMVLSRLTVGWAGLALILLGCFPAFARLHVPRLRLDDGIVDSMGRARVAISAFAQGLSPDFAAALGVGQILTYSWTLIVGGVVVVVLRRLLSPGLALALGLLIPPLIKGPLCIQLDSERVSIRRWLWKRTFVRSPAAPVQFFAVPARGTGALKGQERLTLSMRFGYREIRLAGVMPARDAQRLAAGLNYARDQVDGGLGFPMQPDLMGMSI